MFIKIHVLFAIYFTKVWKVKNFSATHTLQAWSNLGILDLEKNPFILTLIEYEYDRMVKNVIRQTLNYFGHFHHTLQNKCEKQKSIKTSTLSLPSIGIFHFS